MQLNDAGRQLVERLRALGLTKGDLVREMNRRRAAVGVRTRVAPLSLRRWTTANDKARLRINIDDAVLIEIIAGLPVAAWSRYNERLVAHAMATGG
jgi:hypothetical protein